MTTVQPQRLPSPRWTATRLQNTAYFAFIGAIVGPGLAASWTLSVMLLSAAILRSPDGFAFGGILSAVLFPIPYLLMRSASYGTCRRHPTAPTGIALGVVVGFLIVTAFFLQVLPRWSLPVALLAALALALAAYQGGMRALRESLGQLRAGIGLTCAHCGYDLSATPEHRVCPECGGSMRYERPVESRP